MEETEKLTPINTKENIAIKLKDEGNCETENVIYAAHCKKHDVIIRLRTGLKSTHLICHERGFHPPIWN